MSVFLCVQMKTVHLLSGMKSHIMLKFPRGSFRTRSTWLLVDFNDSPDCTCDLLSQFWPFRIGQNCRSWHVCRSCRTPAQTWYLCRMIEPKPPPSSSGVSTHQPVLLFWPPSLCGESQAPSAGTWYVFLLTYTHTLCCKGMCPIFGPL